MSEISTEPNITLAETEDGFMIVDNPITQTIYAVVSPVPPPNAYNGQQLETIDITESVPEPKPTPPPISKSIPGKELVGGRIEVRWNHPNEIPGDKKWYSAKVMSYCPDSGCHRCLYDDGDYRAYHLWQKAFHVLDKK